MGLACHRSVLAPLGSRETLRTVMQDGCPHEKEGEAAKSILDTAAKAELEGLEAHIAALKGVEQR